MTGGHRSIGIGGDLDKEVVRRGIYCIDDGGSRRHGATESRRQIRLDRQAQGGRWRRDSVEANLAKIMHIAS